MRTDISLLLLCITVIFSSTTFADGEKLKDKLADVPLTITANIKGCNADLQKFCKGLDPSSQNAMMCMVAYEEKLSEQCKLGIAEAAVALKMGTAALNHSIGA
ncbi:MAG: hypothetical protein ACC707_06570, partial [Thiohalomonadales bacterium]